MQVLLHSDHYVYIYFDLNGHPLYVGKGRRGRWKKHLRDRTNRRLSIALKKSKGALPVVIVRSGLANIQACETEQVFIKAIGRLDKGEGPLVNETDGGIGTFGRKFTPEAREKIRQARLGSKMSAAQRQKCRERMLQFRHTEASKEKIRQSKLGKPLSNEVRRAMSIGGKGKILTEEHKAKLAANFQRPKSEAHKRKLRKHMIAMNKARAGMHLNLETRHKMSRSQTLRQVNKILHIQYV